MTRASFHIVCEAIFIALDTNRYETASMNEDALSIFRVDLLVLEQSHDFATATEKTLEARYG